MAAEAPKQSRSGGVSVESEVPTVKGVTRCSREAATRPKGKLTAFDGASAMFAVGYS